MPELVKIRMLRTAKELVSGSEWTTFVKGDRYTVLPRIARCFLGVKACELVDPPADHDAADDDAADQADDVATEEEEAERQAKQAEDDRKEQERADEESKMDAGPPENKAVKPAQNKAPARKPRGTNGKRKAK